LLEPGRTLSGGADHLASHASDVYKLRAEATVGRPLADAEPKLPRQFRSLDHTVAVLIKLRKVFGEVQHLSLAKAIVVLGIDQAAALVHNRDVSLAAWPPGDGVKERLQFIHGQLAVAVAISFIKDVDQKRNIRVLLQFILREIFLVAGGHLELVEIVPSVAIE